VVELSRVAVVVLFWWVALLRRWAARTIKLGTTQKHVTAVSGIKTCKAALKDELKPEIQAQRVA
jgi:hypothetical protein